MTLNQDPHYEAIGHCVFLKEKIKSRIEALDNRLSRIHELGIAPSYFCGNKPEISIYSTYFKMHPPIQQKAGTVRLSLSLPVHLEVY